MAYVTVTGGSTAASIALAFDSTDATSVAAQSAAYAIDAIYGTGAAAYYGSTSATTGYLVVAGSYTSGQTIAANTGFGAILVNDDGVSPGLGDTITAGGYSGVQTVIAGDGSTTITASTGNEDVYIGGGTNYLSFFGNTGTVTAYVQGDIWFIGGNGNTSLDLTSDTVGPSNIGLYGGFNNVTTSSAAYETNITVHGGGGDDDTIVNTGGTDFITTNNSANSYVINLSGAGTDIVSVEAGAASSVLVNGSGVTGGLTIYGGGSNELLIGGSNSLLVDYWGSETLVGGGSDVTFDLSWHDGTNTSTTAGVGTGVTILDFSSTDTIDLGSLSGSQLTAVEDSATNVDGNLTYTLTNGATLTIVGYTTADDSSVNAAMKASTHPTGY